MSFKDWFTYMLKKWVGYMETPKEERILLKQQHHKEDWSTRWFGLLPSSIKYSVDEARKRFR